MAEAVLSNRAVKILAAFVLVAGLVAAFVVVQGAQADHTPADKVVSTGAQLDDFNQPTGDHTLMEVGLRSSTPSDLMITVSLECTILTNLVTNTDNPNAKAEARILGWIEITDLSGSVFPTSDGKVTFCDRVYERRMTDNDGGGLDQEADYIRTKSAHAFTWIALNLGKGLHTVEFHVELEDSDTACVVSTGPAATTCSDAIVGNRTLVVEPTKLSSHTDSVG